MKKHLCLTLALIIALCIPLTACGGESDVKGNVTPDQETTASIPAGTVEQTVPENELSLGRMEGGTYTNEYVGYACKLDSNWTFRSAEELQEIPDTVSDMISGSELGDALADVQQFTDMMAENATDLATMNVLYQKLSLQERLAYAALTEEQVVDATLDQQDMMIQAYAQAGITVISMDKVTVNFMGEERTAIHTEAAVQDIPYFMLQFFDFDLGGYGVTTTLASYEEDKTVSLAALFYKLEK